MSDDKWQGWEFMWTTHFDKYALLRFSLRGNEYEIILELPAKIITIENDEAYLAVKEKMRQAGNRIVTREEAWSLMGRDPADLPDF